MTVDVHPETVEQARQRGGDAAEDRPDEYDKILNRAELGHGEGDPLVRDSYDDYLGTEDFADPDARVFLTDLFAHDAVNSLDDAVDELTPIDETATRNRWHDALERAISLHDIDTSDHFEDTEEQKSDDADSRLVALLGYEPPEDTVDPSNTILVAELYASLGLSVTEVADVLGDEIDDRDVRPATVRDTLKRVGYLGGSTREEQRDAFEENDGRLGGATLDFSETNDGNPGVNINSETVARDPNVSVERGE